MKSSVKKQEKDAFDHHECNDIQLWDSFRNGNADALACIYSTHYPLLLQYGLRLSSDREFVKDCIHGLFEDLYHYRETAGCVKNISGYLSKSLRNKMLRNRKKYTTSDTVNDASCIEKIVFDEHFDEQENHCELHHLLCEALKKIPERQKEAIYLRYFFKMNNEEVAQMMEITYQVACNTISNALKSLLKILPKKLKDAYFQRETAWLETFFVSD